MKFLLAICLIAFATVAVASDRAIYDLQYLPNAGTTYGFSELGLSQGRVKVESFDYTVDYQAWVVKQTIGHAITDRLSISANANFTHVDSESDFAGTKSTDSTKGISDPTISARFRALDESLRLDFTGDVTIGTGDSTTKGHETNNKQGGNSARFGAELGVKQDGLQLTGIAQLNHSAKSTSESDGTESKDDAHNEFVFGGAALIKAAESSYLKGSLTATFADEYDGSDDSTTSSSTLYTIGAEYQHVISKDLLARVGVQWLNGHADQIESYNLYTLIAGANYQF
jgi:hypothetical protein